MSSERREDARKMHVPAIHEPSNTSKQRLAFRNLVHRLSPAIQMQLSLERRRQKSRIQNSGIEKDVNSDRSLFNRERGSVQLEEELSLAQLKKLMKLFKTHRPETGRRTTSLNSISLKPRTSGNPGLMNFKEFKKALCKAFQLEDEELDEQFEELFRKVDVSSDGLVDWDELSSYILLRLREKDVVRLSSHGKVFICPPRVVRVERSKEPTCRILIASNPTRYITLSKDGIFRIWNTKLVLQRSLTMEGGGSSVVQSSPAKRSMKMWVTDAVVMENVHKMAVATTNMDIYFYDMSTPVYTPQFHLCGLSTVAFCMDYYYCEKNPANESLLFYGDDKGRVHLLIFHVPLKGLFETPFKKNGGSHRVFMQEIPLQSHLVTHVILDELHSDWVRRLRYYPSSDVLLSCSGNRDNSLVVRGVVEKARHKVYVYKISKGIDCFDYSKDRNIIATGGMDHVVRLWNPYVTIKPVAILRGHIARVIDVVIHEQMGQVFSYASDTVLKTWDIKEHHCIQSIHLKHPYDPHPVEHGPFPAILVRAPACSLLIACEDCLTELQLVDQQRNKRDATSHERPICAALYNANKKQVITGCEGSIVRTWNVETGRKVFEFAGVLGDDEMSCMALEDSGRRLFTGSRNGMVYIWTAGNGQLLHRCEPEVCYECEVTAIQPLPERSYTLSVGWSRRIIMYHDDSEMLTVSADPSWKGGHVHEDDILCIAHCPPYLIATGSFDGDLILWSLERQNIFKRLKRGSGSLFKSKIKKIGLAGNRRRHKQENKHAVPVDALLFLESRARMKDQDNAILVSSQAGVLEFWSMFGPLRPRGFFYAPDGPGGTVLSLATDQDNEMVVSGDSSGNVAVWDIRDYCTMKLMASVAKVWAAPKRQMLLDPSDTPLQKHKWQAHTKAVVSLQVIDRPQQKLFVLSASVDCTAKLWTIHGDVVGMFGQEEAWDLKSLSDLVRSSTESTQKRENVEDDFASDSKKDYYMNSTSPADPEKTHPDKIINSGDIVRPHTSGKIIESTSKAFSFENGGECDPENTRYAETFGFERSLTEWSILGEKYNKKFERRMTDRKNRRGNLGHVDATVTKGGGLGSSCSPFQALHVLTANEFELPRDLPMTPRMVRKSRLSPDETWQKYLTSLSLPPILMEENGST